MATLKSFLTTKTLMKIIVLGAGVIGITTAYYLNQAGHEVTVIDRAALPSQMTSFANGGQLSYSYTDPTAQPYLLAQLPSLMWHYYAPLTIRFSLSPAFLRWTWLFLRNCQQQRVIENTLKTLKLAFHSRTALHALLAAHPLAFHYQKNGKLYLYMNEKEFARGVKRCELKNQWGCEQQVLSVAECIAKEPQLRHIQHKLVGGVFSPLDESGDAYVFSQALAELCQRNGVAFLFNTEIQALHYTADLITEVQTTRGHYAAEAFVLATATDSPRLLKPLGIKLPVYPMKGYSLSIPVTEHSPQTCLTDSQHRIVYSRLGEVLRVAGMAEVGSTDLTLNPKKLALITELARSTFPQGGHYDQVTSWSGLRPMTPDSAPILGPTPYSNLYLNTGHGMLGWTLACGSASVLSAVIDGDTPAVPLAGLDLARFD